MTDATRTLTTTDGLVLEMNSAKVSGLGFAGERFACAGGLLVRDVAADSAFVPADSDTCATMGLRAELSAEATGNHIAFSGCITDITGHDRAVTVRFALPIDTAGWTWHDDVRASRAIETGARYIHATDMQTGAGGEHSLYPLGAITRNELGLSLAADMLRCPAQTRIACDDGVFYLEYDFGLAPETDAFPSAAPFAFVLFGFDGNDGFRGALARFYAIFADCFERRLDTHGAWMPFADISAIEGFEDFGFAFHEGAVHNQFNASHGIGNYRYSEPSTWWMNMPDGMERSYENVDRMIREYAAGDDETFKLPAQVTLASVAYNEQGRMQYQSRDLPWCHGVCFSSNPNPNLPEPCEGRTLLWNDADRAMLYGLDTPGLQAGEYLDSLEAYATEAENHRREHFRHVTVPLTFSRESKSPCIHKALSVFEFCKVLAGDLHAMGKTLFCNSAPERYAFLTPFFDVMGIEVEWVGHEGEWVDPGDDVCNFKRAMMGTRPYALLLNTPFEKLTPPIVERYFQRSLFYGFLPSMFSHNAAEDIYWSKPEWYNRDRHFFLKYGPMCREVSEAGWQVLTHARSDNPTIAIERFGQTGAIYLTLLNTSEADQQATITLDTAALGVDLADTLTDDVTSDTLPVTRSPGAATLTISLAAERATRLTLRSK